MIPCAIPCGDQTMRTSYLESCLVAALASARAVDPTFLEELITRLGDRAHPAWLADEIFARVPMVDTAFTSTDPALRPSMG